MRRLLLRLSEIHVASKPGDLVFARRANELYLATIKSAGNLCESVESVSSAVYAFGRIALPAPMDHG